MSEHYNVFLCHAAVWFAELIQYGVACARRSQNKYGVHLRYDGLRNACLVIFFLNYGILNVGLVSTLKN